MLYVQKALTQLYSNLLDKMGQDIFDRQYVPEEGQEMVGRSQRPGVLHRVGGHTVPLLPDVHPSKHIFIAIVPAFREDAFFFLFIS